MSKKSRIGSLLTFLVTVTTLGFDMEGTRPTQKWNPLAILYQGLEGPDKEVAKFCDRWKEKCSKVAKVRGQAFDYAFTDVKKAEEEVVRKMVALARSVRKKKKKGSLRGDEIENVISNFYTSLSTGQKGLPPALATQFYIARQLIERFANEKDDSEIEGSRKNKEAQFMLTITRAVQDSLIRCGRLARKEKWANSGHLTLNNVKKSYDVDVKVLRAWELVFRTKLITYPNCDDPFHEDFFIEFTDENEQLETNKLAGQMRRDLEKAKRSLEGNEGLCKATKGPNLGVSLAFPEPFPSMGDGANSRTSSLSSSPAIKPGGGRFGLRRWKSLANLREATADLVSSKTSLSPREYKPRTSLEARQPAGSKVKPKGRSNTMPSSRGFSRIFGRRKSRRGNRQRAATSHLENMPQIPPLRLPMSQ